MNRSPRAINVVAALGCVASCGYTMPYRSSGPAVSKEGVELAVAGERCFVNRSGEQYPTVEDEDRLNLGLQLQVKNRSSHVAVLALNYFRLSEAMGSTRTVMPPRESGTLVIDPGETKIVALDFEKEGELDCHHEMALEAAGAIAIEGGQVSVEPIRFLASR